MSSVPKGLGRGLDALFNNVASNAGASTVSPSELPPLELPLDKLIPNAGQPRKHFSREALDELAASIRSQGIVQPLLVRPKAHTDTYEIIAGERRWRAAGLADCKTVPVYIRNLTDDEVMLASLIENLQREDLNPIEEALALQNIKEHCYFTQEDLAMRLGKSRSAIANSLRLLSLSMVAQDDIQFGRMQSGHARTLLSIADEEHQELLRQAIVEKGLTVRDAEEAAIEWKGTGSFPWDKEKHPGETALDDTTPQDIPTISPRTKPQRLKELEAMVAYIIKAKTKIAGDESRGKITLSYGNAEQLARLLARLGVNT